MKELSPRFAIPMLAAAALAATAVAPAMAQDTGVYANFGYTHLETDDDVSQGLLNGRLGYQVTPMFGVEADVGVGVVDDTVLGVDLETDATLGAFAVARVPVMETINLLGRVGYQHSWVTASTPTASADDDDGSFAIGVGAETMLDSRNGIRADYTRFTDNGGANAFSIAYVRKF